MTKMNKFLQFLIISSLILVSGNAYAEESFESFADRVDSWVTAMQGVVVSVDKDSYSIDIGKNSGILKGIVLNVSKEGEELLHPTTGALLGKKRFDLGQVKITEIYDKYSVGTPIGEKKSGVVKGVQIGVENPLPVRIDIDSLDKKNGAEAKFAILKAGLVEESDNSSYLISCALDEKNSQAVCSFSSGSIKIVNVDVPLLLPVITTASNTVNIKNGRGLSPLFSQNLDKIYISAAAGNAFGKDKSPTVVLADEGNVYIYSILGETLGVPTFINKNFKGIINVEMADLNGNGIDEIFISNMDKKDKIASYIYEYNGTDFVQLKSGIDLLFRSFFTNGKKKIICQSFAEGDFTGMIYSYGYGDNGYEQLEAYDQSFGAKLYGFAYGAFGAKNMGVTFNFDNTGNFFISLSDGSKYLFGKEFGFTPHKLLYSKVLMKGTEKNNDGAIINIFDTKTYGFPIYQRMIEVDASPSKFFFTGNNAERRRDGGVDYLSSFLGVYMFIGRESVSLWKHSGGEKVSLESDIVYSGDKKYIVSLSWEGKNGGIFSPTTSILEVFTIDY